MNSAVNYKKVILDYITGTKVLDVGPGGGLILDLIEENLPQCTATGIDISKNVLESLEKKKHLENRKWNVMYGDALNLSEYVEKGSMDTIIFCSIIHELFSYIELDGRKFNYDVIRKALKSAYEVLPKGGRIIIRNGIMTSPKEEKRIIKFLSEDGTNFLKQYAQDFQGRQIQYEILGHNEVIMPVNDAMEMLYTYTWGEDSYVHEVQEQFGYFTPEEYVEFIRSVLGDSASVVTCRHSLQDGYTIALSGKVQAYDENRQPTRLPDSTAIIVIEKN